MMCEEVINGLLQKGVAISHCRQLKRTVVNPENVRTSMPLPIWVVTIDKTKENIAKLHEIRGIHHFLIKVSFLRYTC